MGVWSADRVPHHQPAEQASLVLGGAAGLGTRLECRQVDVRKGDSVVDTLVAQVVR